MRDHAARGDHADRDTGGQTVRAVALDLDSLHPEDLDLSSLCDGGTASVCWTHYGVTPPSEVVARIAAAEVVMTNKVVLDAAVLSQAPALRCVLIAATGTNNVDLAECFRRQIQVCHVRDYGSQAVAQHTFALLLSLAGSVKQYDLAVRQGQWAKSPFFCLFDYPVVELAGKTLGIVGYGAIGQTVARMAKAFDMNVMVAESRVTKSERASRSSDEKQPVEKQATVRASDLSPDRYPLPELLAQSDVVSLHCPLTPETHHLINEQTLALMKPSAFLINTGRGDLVAPEALLSALSARRLAGAGLDVLSQEPPSVSDSLIQADLPNLIITPHMAWASQQARQNIINQVAESLNDFLQGRPPARLLNP